MKSSYTLNVVICQVYLKKAGKAYVHKFSNSKWIEYGKWIEFAIEYGKSEGVWHPRGGEVIKVL